MNFKNYCKKSKKVAYILYKKETLTQKYLLHTFTIYLHFIRVAHLAVNKCRKVVRKFVSESHAPKKIWRLQQNTEVMV